MYYKIEPTGCCERKGNVQVRYCFYLEEGDYGYEKHCIDVPVFPEEEFKGTDEERIDLIKTLPTKKQINPFHNHFCYFNHDVTDKEITDKGEELLVDIYKQWSEDKKPNIINSPVTINKNKDVVSLCDIKVNYIKEKQWQ